MQAVNDPTVSVWMTTYNHEDYISEAIESVLMQKTSFKIDLVIGEDYSTDDTRGIAVRYREKYPEIIKLVLQEKNQGMMRNAISASYECKGKYIAILEGDDFWTDPYKLQKQVEFLDANEDYGLVWTDVDFYDQIKGKVKNAVFKNKLLPRYGTFNDTIINKPYFAPPTWLFRREYLPVGLEEYCDGTFPIILDILAKTKIKYMDQVTATYRQLDESASNSNNILKRYKFLSGVYRIQKDYIIKYKLSDSIEEEIDFKHFKAALPYAVILGDKETIERAKLILKNRPDNDIKVRVTLLLSKFYLGVLLIRTIYNNKLLKYIFSSLPLFR